MMYRPRVVLGVVAIAVVALSVCLLFKWQGSEMESPIPRSDEGTSARTVLTTDDVDKWVQHLAEEGLLRFVPEEETGAGEPERVVQGQGTLTPEEMAFAVDSVERVISKKTAALNRHYAGSSSSSAPDEEWRLKEARLSYSVRRHEAYLKALQAGSYVVVRTADDVPPLPKGVSGLNLGVSHKGQDMLLTIILRQGEYGMDEAEVYVEQAQLRWVAAVAHRFNGLSLPERQRMVARWAANRKTDKAWRAEHFPPPIQVDRESCIVYVNQ